MFLCGCLWCVFGWSVCFGFVCGCVQNSPPEQEIIDLIVEEIRDNPDQFLDSNKCGRISGRFRKLFGSNKRGGNGASLMKFIEQYSKIFRLRSERNGNWTATLAVPLSYFTSSASKDAQLPILPRRPTAGSAPVNTIFGTDHQGTTSSMSPRGGPVGARRYSGLLDSYISRALPHICEF